MAFTDLITDPWFYVGIVAILALIGIFRVKESKVLGFNKWVPGLIMSALLVTGVYQTGIIDNLGFGKQTFAVSDVPEIPSATTSPNGLTQQETPTPPSPGGKICRIQSDGTNSLDVAVRNKENSTLGYLGVSTSATANDGSTLDTATTTGGASLTYQTLNVPGCQDGNIYILATSGIGTASAKAPFSSFEETTKYELVSAGSNVVSVLGRDSALAESSSGIINGSVGDEVQANQRISGAGASDGTSYYKNTSLASGGSINGYLDYTVNGTASVYGTYEASDGALFSYDSATASVFSRESFSLSDQTGINLKELTSCPATITANRNAEKCWSARTLKATDGEIRTKFQLKADLADPVESTVKPLFCLDDKVYFRDTNGKIAYDFFSSSGTNQGAGGICVQFVGS